MLCESFLEVIILKLYFLFLPQDLLVAGLELSTLNFKGMILTYFFFQEFGHFFKFIVFLFIGIGKFFELLVFLIVLECLNLDEEFLNSDLFLANLHLKEIIFFTKNVQLFL